MNQWSIINWANCLDLLVLSHHLLYLSLCYTFCSAIDIQLYKLILQHVTSSDFSYHESVILSSMRIRIHFLLRTNSLQALGKQLVTKTSCELVFNFF